MGHEDHLQSTQILKTKSINQENKTTTTAKHKTKQHKNPKDLFTKDFLCQGLTYYPQLASLLRWVRKGLGLGSCKAFWQLLAEHFWANHLTSLGSHFLSLSTEKNYIMGCVLHGFPVRMERGVHAEELPSGNFYIKGRDCSILKLRQ